MAKICIVGGGASGLMAAYAAGKNGHEVLLLEQNEKLGKKIYITGKGRCNFTNDVPPQEFLQNVVRGEKFMRGAIYTFSSQNSIEMLENYGLSVKTERGNRVFPISDHASDVTKTLEKACKSVGVDVKLGEKALKINTMQDIIPMCDIDSSVTRDVIPVPRIVSLQTSKGLYECDYIIVATGGLSYPSTGSSGDGYHFARDLGIKVTDLKCGLCGLNLKGSLYKDLQGVSLKNVTATIKLNEKVLFSQFGEMLFTHFGVSGPIILSLSSLINRQPLSQITLSVDLKPALSEDMLDKRLLRDFDKYKNKQLFNAMVDLLPSKLISVVLLAAKIDGRKNVNVLTKEERLAIIRTVKDLSFKIDSLRGFEEAIITSGGVDLSEINPKTMESKKIKGLKFCGEVLDVDAFTGGFNMQIAFSTGFVAGNTI